MTSLHPNVPNPFNPRTTLSFELATASHASIQIYAVNGRLVRTLVQSEYSPGRYAVDWMGTDASGQTAASGTYLVRMVAPDGTHTRRILLLK